MEESGTALGLGREDFGAALVDVLHEASEVGGVGLGQDAVAEVEDVARATSGAGKYVVGTGLGYLEGSEEHGGVEVALNAVMVANAGPRAVKGHTPIDAHQVAAYVGHEFKEGSRPGSEMNGGHSKLAKLLEDAAGVGHDVLLVLVGTEDADPAIEELHHLDAGLNLATEIEDDYVGDLLHQRVPDGWLREHEALGVGVVAGGTTLDHVAGKGEGGAGETDEGSAVTKLLAEKFDGFEDIGGALFGADDCGWRRRRPWCGWGLG